MEEPREIPSPKPPRHLETVAERTRRLLDELAEQGFFQNLPGSGKPLDLSDEDNPFVPEDMRLAYRILRNAGYSLPWIELRKDIEADVAALDRRARAHREMIRSTLQNLHRLPPYLRAARWQRTEAEHRDFVASYGAMIDEVNRKIDDFNLSVPVVSLQVARINRQHALAQIASCLPETPG